MLYEQERYKEAVSLFGKAIEINRKDSYTYFNKELALRHLGSSEEAEKAHLEGVKLLEEEDPSCRSLLLESIESSIATSNDGQVGEGLLEASQTKLSLLKQLLERLKSTKKEEQ